MTTRTVIVHVRTGMAIFQATLASVIGLAWVMIGIANWRQHTVDGQMVAMGILGGLLIFAFAAHFFGIAIRRPVALRMDSKGISGYYAEPAVWPEIMEIDTYTASKGQRYLCFAFLNPDIIGARQPFHRKVYNWVHNPGFGSRYQIVIPQAILHNSDVSGLAAQAEVFRRAA